METGKKYDAAIEIVNRCFESLPSYITRFGHREREKEKRKREREKERKRKRERERKRIQGHNGRKRNGCEEGTGLMMIVVLGSKLWVGWERKEDRVLKSERETKREREDERERGNGWGWNQLIFVPGRIHTWWNEEEVLKMDTTQVSLTCEKNPGKLSLLFKSKLKLF